MECRDVPCCEVKVTFTEKSDRLVVFVIVTYRHRPGPKLPIPDHFPQDNWSGRTIFTTGDLVRPDQFYQDYFFGDKLKCCVECSLLLCSSHLLHSHAGATRRCKRHKEAQALADMRRCTLIRHHTP